MTGIKAIADENRLKLIKLLLTKNYCVRALANQLKLSESAVSQHLKILREADIVMGEKKGYYVHYNVKTENLKNIGNYIIKLGDTNIKDINGCCKKE